MVEGATPNWRVRLDFGYDGTEFAGWARQPGLRTVQGELEAGLAKVLRPAPAAVAEFWAERGGVPLTVAGRTDAGVHARGQVAHFDLPPEVWAALPGRSDRLPQRALVDRLAAVLPPDIVINKAALVPGDFDARFSAASRHYIYRIADTPTARDALHRHYVMRWNRHLDVNLMDEASRQLVGLHDFAAYCRPRPGATTIRRLLTFAWRRPQSGPDAGLVVGTVRADAFCHNMVRALVGAAIRVGEGKAPVTWPYEVLRAGQRELAAPLVPPHGLTLEAVSYPPLPYAIERAGQIRAKRSL
ncbi:MAG: tRNA pseudouridine(38-40) synthase TruA [Cellulomonadaceae bacterium]|jgi:tRNA pseudouridine38-40 synthase|nr:tRNA pseudouridine(38-40) synthase TruA [Cellulomonadaceae bacterium]